MSSLSAFIQISLDGYYCTTGGDMSWAHKSAEDKEWTEFMTVNSAKKTTLLFGRKTYEMMASFWPTPRAAAYAADTAKNINRARKVVVSTTLRNPTWNPTTLISKDVEKQIAQLKAEENLVTLGSGELVTWLTERRLIDHYTMVICPIALGSGRPVFGGLKRHLSLRAENTRSFKNGTTVIDYALLQATPEDPVPSNGNQERR
jgi:dihydrofolate reductase